MSGDPVSVDPDASALEALDLMVERGIRHLPVLDSRHRVVGVLAVEDLRAALPVPVRAREPLPPDDREIAREWRVGDIMTHAPETIGEDAGLAEAAERMADARIGCLPVVDADGRLAAILTETDLLHALATALWSERVRERPHDDPLVPFVVALKREQDRLRALLAGDGTCEEALDRHTRRRMEAIQLALERAEAGRLAVCERCSGAIALTRLRALPGTGLCVACARRGAET